MYLMRFISFILFYISILSASENIIPIHIGWQMVGSSGELDSLQDFNRSEIDIVWYYDSSSGKWKAFSGNEDTIKLLKDSGYETLDATPVGFALWVYANTSGILKMTTINDSDTIDIKEGWQLLSSRYGIDDTNIFDKDGIGAIWTYDGLQNIWKIYDKGFNSYSQSVKPIENIRDAEGFWVYSDTQTTLEPNPFEEINDTSEEVQPTANAYEYDSDGTAMYKLDQNLCNQWQEDGDYNSSNITEVMDYYKEIAAQAINDTTFRVPVYAPQGVAGDFNVTVQNGVLDFSDYKVPGDVTGDGRVDMEDVNMIVNALGLSAYMTPSADLYDVNGDGTVDKRDILYIMARLTTQVDHFDFYTVDGDKLPIDSIGWYDEHRVQNLDSSVPSVVRVIARDENGASSSKDPKITQNAWYKKLNKTLNKPFEGCEMDIALIAPIFSAPAGKYVIGYSANIKFSGGTIINGKKVKNTLNGCQHYIRDLYMASSVHKYFTPTNMEKIVKFGQDVDNVTMAIQDGFRFETNVLKNLKLRNELIKDLDYDQSAVHTSVYKSHVSIDNKTYVVYQLVHALRVYIESKKKYSAHGKITRNASDKYEDCGQIRFHRYGPAHQMDDEAVDLKKVSDKETKFEFKENLSSGHYHQSAIIWPKGSEYILNKEFIVHFDKANEINFNIPWSPNSIKGHLYDKNHKPIKKKQMVLRSTCDHTLKKYVTTDENGFFEFKDADIGEYEVLIDDKPKAVVTQKGFGTTADITDDTTFWKLEVNVKSPILHGSMKVKKIEIDCEHPRSSDTTLGDTCSDWQNSEKSEFSTTGNFLDYADSQSFAVTTKGIWMGSDFYIKDMTQTWPFLAIPSEQVSNAALGCNGLFPANALENIKDKNKIHFSTYANGVTCEFTLEPCKNDECEDEPKKPSNDFDGFDGFPSEDEW